MNPRWWIGLGGGIGALLRYALMNLFPEKPLPYGIFIINILGSFFIAVIMTGTQEFGWPPERLRIFLTVGVLGGFTTFSTFALGTYLLIQQAHFMAAYTYSIGSLFFGLTAAWSGIIFVRTINRWLESRAVQDDRRRDEANE
ncbi:MAG: CrcB family protein [Firmicutes bacterium]|nr:CrcB family protein [Bacillota bacterium]MCL5065311.1 CrcB family protein [Bacillota bacterium]